MDFRLTLTPTTVKQIHSALRYATHHRDTRLSQRLSAIRMLGDNQLVASIAHYLAVSESSVYRWRDTFLCQGVVGLQTIHRNSGRPPKLSPSQKKQLVKVVTAGPEAAGYPTGCWTSALIQTLIAREFGIHYHVGYICELLRNLGFTYQKARFVSDHLDTDTRHIWLTETWPQIVAEAHQHNALLFFGDEASFAHWGSLGYTWAVRGQQLVIKTTGKRKGYKLFGVVEYFTGDIIVQSCPERFTALSYQTFLTAVLTQTTRPIILIQDGARYHTAKNIHAFFAAHADRLTVYQLPSYSPDFNPIEHVWRAIKRQATHNRYFATFDAVVTAVETCLTTFRHHSPKGEALLGTPLDAFVPTPLAA